MNKFIKYIWELMLHLKYPRHASEINAVWLVETACIFLILLIAAVQMSMEYETQES